MITVKIDEGKISFIAPILRGQGDFFVYQNGPQPNSVNKYGPFDTTHEASVWTLKQVMRFVEEHNGTIIYV